MTSSDTGPADLFAELERETLEAMSRHQWPLKTIFVPFLLTVRFWRIWHGGG